MNRLLGVLCLLLVATSQQVRADDSIELAEHVLESLCKSDDVVLDDVDVVLNLAKLIDLNLHLAGEAERACKTRYSEPLHELAAILGDKENSICGQKFVVRAAKFHWRYVMGNINKKWAQHIRRDIPDPLLNFFISYMNEVSRTCMDELQNNLASASKESKVDALKYLNEPLGETLNSIKLGSIDREKVGRYSLFMLPWQLILDKLQRKGNLAEDAIDEEGDNILAFFRAQDPTKIWAVQDLCRTNLRPVYQQTTLPVMRLIDMGYGYPFKGNRKELKANQLLQDWYKITQLCEIVLPVEYLADASLPERKIVMVQEPEEIATIDGRQDLDRNEFIARGRIGSTQNIALLQKSGPIGKEFLQSGKSLRSQLKSAIKDRSRFYSKMFFNAMENVSHGVLERLKNLFTRRNKQEPTIEELWEQVENSEVFNPDEDAETDGVRVIETPNDSISGMVKVAKFGAVYAMLRYGQIAIIIAGGTFLALTMLGLTPFCLG